MTHSSGCRSLIAVAAVLGTFGVTLLPPEHVHEAHVHEAQGAQASQAGAIHRHFQPHHVHGAAGVQVGDHDDDAPAQWLTQTFVAPEVGSTTPVSTHGLIDDIVQSQPQVPSRRVVPPTYASSHDPPWATSTALRAPPFPHV